MRQTEQGFLTLTNSAGNFVPPRWYSLKVCIFLLFTEIAFGMIIYLYN